MDRIDIRYESLGTLSEKGHANNFHLIRLFAALIVVYSHSYALTGVREPTIGRSGVRVTVMALDFFFLTSGFLVTRSLLLRQDLFDFLLSRILRIYPGLIVMVLLTIGIAAAFLGSAFLTDHQTTRYLLATAFLSVKKLAIYDLPGVFQSTPFPRAVNGSLWTLPYEIRMYAVLATLWCVFALRRQSRTRLIAVSVVAITCLAATVKVLMPESTNASFGFMFFAGGSFYVFRFKIPMRADFAWAAAAAVGLSALYATSFAFIYPLLIGYLLFALSYLPRFWRPGNDFSYGTYIYAFPIQQAIVSLVPNITALEMAACAVPIVLVVAAGSWHFVEKPAVRAKHWIIRHRATSF